MILEVFSKLWFYDSMIGIAGWEQKEEKATLVQ